MKKCTACDGKGFIKNPKNPNFLMDCENCDGEGVTVSEQQGPAPDSGGNVGQ